MLIRSTSILKLQNTDLMSLDCMLLTDESLKALVLHKIVAS
jgi:hypothetical protein